VYLSISSAFFNLRFSERPSREKRDFMKSTYLCVNEHSVERMKVCEGDILKFGREIFKATMISKRISPKFQWFKEAQELLALEGECKICLSS